MIDYLALFAAGFAALLMVVTSVEVLAAMDIRRCGFVMWLCWWTISLTSFTGLASLAASGNPPSAAVAFLLLAACWQLWKLRKRLIWQSHNGG